MSLIYFLFNSFISKMVGVTWIVTDKNVLDKLLKKCIANTTIPIYIMHIIWLLNKRKMISSINIEVENWDDISCKIRQGPTLFLSLTAPRPILQETQILVRSLILFNNTDVHNKFLHTPLSLL